jgi:glutamate 5-kinase
MGFSAIVKDVANRVASKVSDVVKNAPTDDSSSGFKKVSDIAKVAEAVPSAKSTTSDVGGMYKRLTASDIEEEKKKKVGMKKGGKVSSASKRADGIATKGKTRGKMV